MNSFPLNQRRINLILLNYAVGYLFLYPRILGMLLWLFPSSTRESVSFIFENLIYVFVFVSTVILAWPMLKQDAHKIRNRKLSFLKNTGKRYIQMYVVMIVGNVLVMLITGMENSANQQEVISQIASHPLQILLVSSVFAPLCEEVVFRGVIFKPLRQKTGFAFAAFVSAFLFGLLHVYVSLLRGNWMDLVYILVYGSMGWVLSKAVQDYDCIYSSILIHALNNLFASIMLM